MSGIFSFLFRIVLSKYKKDSKDLSKFLTPKKFAEIEEIIGFKISNKNYFTQALIHRSYLDASYSPELSNERLEFLGDAVLNLVVAEFLFDNFRDKDEGFLTKTRSKLVNRNALSDAAERINLIKHILISKQLKNTLSNGIHTVLADALEALIGAIYLDGGLGHAEKFIKRVIVEPSSKEGVYLKDENFKSQLLEYAQANKFENPRYEVIKEDGPQHDRIFTVRVSVGSEITGNGTGRNKKTAEQNAAHDALSKIHMTD